MAKRGRLKPEVLVAFAAANGSAAQPRKVRTKAPSEKPARKAAAKTVAKPVAKGKKPAPRPTPVAKLVPAAAAPTAHAAPEDPQIAELEAALTALAVRVAKLEAVPAAPEKKRFSRKA